MNENRDILLGTSLKPRSLPQAFDCRESLVPVQFCVCYGVQAQERCFQAGCVSTDDKSLAFEHVLSGTEPIAAFRRRRALHHC